MQNIKYFLLKLQITRSKYLPLQTSCQTLINRLTFRVHIKYALSIELKCQLEFNQSRIASLHHLEKNVKYFQSELNNSIVR